MTYDEYDKIINDAIDFAKSSSWNSMFELSLLKNGLKIVSEQPDFTKHSKNCMSPVPASGLAYTYPYPSWIVEV